ncbi:unnamed protein product, partial [Brenthis ino]
MAVLKALSNVGNGSSVRNLRFIIFDLTSQTNLSRKASGKKDLKSQFLQGVKTSQSCDLSSIIRIFGIQASSSFNPFCEDEDSEALAPPPTTSKSKNSEVETPPTTPTVKRRKTILESEEESKPLRAEKLRSFLSQRVASGYTTQSDLSKRGNYFFELLVYNADEVEKIPATLETRNLHVKTCH